MLCIVDAYEVKNISKHILLCTTISFVAPLQYFLQRHLNRIRQAFDAAGKVVQTGKYPEPVFLPISLTDSAKVEDGSIIKNSFHLKTWKADRLMCSFKASNIGGIFSTVLSLLANRILLATLILHALIVELCRLTTNCSNA